MEAGEVFPSLHIVFLFPRVISASFATCICWLGPPMVYRVQTTTCYSLSPTIARDVTPNHCIFCAGAPRSADAPKGISAQAQSHGSQPEPSRSPNPALGLGIGGGRQTWPPCRLLVTGEGDAGQSVVSGALLRALVGVPMHCVSLAALMMAGEGDPVHGCMHIVQEALRRYGHCYPGYGDSSEAHQKHICTLKPVPVIDQGPPKVWIHCTPGEGD
jgi:hypothetical protein